ncbi:MAG: hypothetical protein ACOC2N_00045 [Spirochaetota bacterium]
MAKSDVFNVAPGRTIRRRDGAKFPAGSEVSPDILGLNAKEFGSLVKDGVVVELARAKAEKPEPPGDGDGEKGDEKK